MSLLLESIRVFNGQFENLDYHQRRIDLSRKSLFEKSARLYIKKELVTLQVPGKGLYKCRFLYGEKVETIEFHPYQTRELRALKLVENNHINYPFKFTARDELNSLFGQRGDCDDVLIVKDGKITDCSIANIIFKKDGQWITPATPLLAGTMRQKLLDDGIIKEAVITLGDLHQFESFKVINSMMRFDQTEKEIKGII